MSLSLNILEAEQGTQNLKILQEMKERDRLTSAAADSAKLRLQTQDMDDLADKMADTVSKMQKKSKHKVGGEPSNTKVLLSVYTHATLRSYLDRI